jgi:hypothetical protein
VDVEASANGKDADGEGAEDEDDGEDADSEAGDDNDGDNAFSSVENGEMHENDNDNGEVMYPDTVNEKPPFACAAAVPSICSALAHASVASCCESFTAISLAPFC